MARYTTARLETTDTTRRDAVAARQTGGRHAYIGDTARETTTRTTTHTTRGTTTNTTARDDTTTRELVDLLLWGMAHS